MLTFSATNFSHLKREMEISHYIDSQQRTIKNLDHEGKDDCHDYFLCLYME